MEAVETSGLLFESPSKKWYARPGPAFSRLS